MGTFSPAALPLGENLEQGVECRALVDMSTHTLLWHAGLGLVYYVE